MASIQWLDLQLGSCYTHKHTQDTRYVLAQNGLLNGEPTCRTAFLFKSLESNVFCFYSDKLAIRTTHSRHWIKVPIKCYALYVAASLFIFAFLLIFRFKNQTAHLMQLYTFKLCLVPLVFLKLFNAMSGHPFL